MAIKVKYVGDIPELQDKTGNVCARYGEKMLIRFAELSTDNPYRYGRHWFPEKDFEECHSTT